MKSNLLPWHRNFFAPVAHVPVSILRRLNTCFCGVLLIALWQIAAQAAPPAAGLVGWWQGEGNGNDSAGGHNGTLLNGVAFAPGISGQAFSFAGTANRVYIPDSPDFKLTNSLSVGAWVFVKANCWHILERSGSQPGSDAYALSIDGIGHAQFMINGLTAFEKVFAPIEYQKWNQVTGTFDGQTGDLRLYINGALVAQKFTAVRPLGDLDPNQQPGIGIGNSPVTGAFPFIGLIDDVVLYSRALSPDEVITLATSTSSAPVITTEPADAMGYIGSDLILTVAAHGASPLSYLWYKDGAPLLWATNATLVLSNLTVGTEGHYVVVISNPFGFVVSATAQVTVQGVELSVATYAGLTISGVVGATYGLEYSTNLSPSATWTALTNVTLTQPVQIWCDTSTSLNSPANPRRFYRAFRAGQ